MIFQKQHKRQYQLHKAKYDTVLQDVMDNGLDAAGKYTELCQEQMKEVTGRRHVIMTMSGTAAITAAIYALDLFDKKVAVGSYNYVACVNQYQAFSKPIYVDCDEDTLLDIKQIPQGCDAVNLVNYWGNVSDYNALKHEGKIITDCSQSFGAKYNGRNDGYFGDISTFSFGGQKPVGTRGFTGACATDDDHLAHKIDCAINHGKSGEDRELPIEMLGFRGAAQELQCAILSVGMKYWKEWKQDRTDIARHIMAELDGYPLRFFKPNAKCEPSYFKLGLEVENRDHFLKAMQHKGIDAQIGFFDNFSDMWGDSKSVPMTQRLNKTSVSLPLSPFFTKEEVSTMITTVKQYFDKVD